MPQTLDVKSKGLVTHPNPLDLPPGSLLVADNIVIDKEGTNELRRGFKRYGVVLSANPKKLFVYKDRLLLHYGTKMAYDSDNVGTWADYSGTYAPPTGADKIRAIEANKNFYFTTSAGIKKIDSVTATPALAGGAKGLDGSGALSGASGFMATNSQVAYRIVWGILDANKNKILGSPSQRIVVGNNSGGTRDVALNFTVPAGVTTSYFYQIYRSGQTGAITDEPNDELQMIVEKNPASGDITNGYVAFTDQTPDSLRGATLYTSPSQQGILQSNEAPPLALDIAYFKNCALYANTISKHRLNITLIGVGGAAFVVDDTITIAGVTYTGKAAENIPAAQFLVSTGGTPAENIDATAKSLIKVINRYASNTSVYAYYLTGFDDLPGQILIEERGIGGSAFVAISSRGTAFSPQIPVSGTTYASDNDVAPNKLYISKASQPEAVPILNYVFVGTADNGILRIIALRDSTFILKQDGIYRMTGETINDFRIALFDSTTYIISQESVTAFNNQVYGFSFQGVTAISDSGVMIVSRPIEKTLLQLASEQYTAFPTVTHGIPYESDRKYILLTVSATADTYPTNAYIYNYVTNTWTRWTVKMSCGIVSDRDNKLYLGSADPADLYVYQERKNYNVTDYADKEYSVTITGHTLTVVNVNSTTNLAAGMSIVQFSGTIPVRNSVIVSVDTVTQITVTDVLSWANAPATVFVPIAAEITYAPVHGGNPAMLKDWQEHLMMFSNADFNKLRISYTTDISISNEYVDISPKSGGLWGLFPWGSVPWGGNITFLQAIRTYLPFDKNRSNWINITVEHEQALTSFAMIGQALLFEEISTRRN